MYKKIFWNKIRQKTKLVAHGQLLKNVRIDTDQQNNNISCRSEEWDKTIIGLVLNLYEFKKDDVLKAYQ